MVHRGTRSKAAQERRAERSILYCKEESYQFGGVELRARSEVNALSHGYSRTDRRSNERNAEANCRTGKPLGGRTPSQRKPRQSSTGVGRFETSEAMRAEVLAFIESRTGSRMTETKVHKHDKIRDDPMDVDSVVKGKGRNKFSGSCYICGRVGHKSTECWSRDRVSNKGSGKTQNANVSSPGKGKDISKDKARAKASGSLKTGKGFRAVDPQSPWRLRRSLGKRPTMQSKSNGGILGLKKWNRREMKLPRGTHGWRYRI